MRARSGTLTCLSRMDSQTPSTEKSSVSRWLFWLGIAACVGVAYVARDYPPKNNRPTFDEVHYLHLLRFGWATIVDGTTNAYYAAKSFPFLFMRNAFSYTAEQGWDFSRWYLDITLFNWACLAYGAWAVFRILSYQKRLNLLLVAIALLLCNRAFLNFYNYYPILGDVFMLALGALIAMGHFLKKRGLIWIALPIAGLTAPQISLFVLIYLAFKPAGGETTEGAPDRRMQALYATLFAVPILATGLYAFYGIPEKSIAVAEAWQNPKYFKDPLVLGLSVVCAAVALYFASLPLSYRKPLDYLRQVAWKHAAAAAAVAALVSWAVGRASGGSKAGADFAAQGIPIKMSYMLSHPGPPGIPSHVIFYGWVAVLVLVFWKSFARWVSEQGAGFALAFSFTLMFMGLDGEVRHVTFMLPMVVIGVCNVADKFLVKLGATKLIWAGLLLSLNWVIFLHADPTYVGERHLSAFGMCWSPTHYFIALAISVAAFVAARAASRR